MDASSPVPPIEGYLAYLERAGIFPGRAENFHRQPDQRSPLIPDGPNPRTHALPGGRKISEFLDRLAGIGADHATLSVAAELEELGDALRGKTVVDVGCGTGILATLAALLGAVSIGTDIDQRAVALAEKTAAANRASLKVVHGSLCAPLANDLSVDLFIANLPHKPCRPRDTLPVSQAGGPQGDAVFDSALAEFVRRQTPGGQLLFFMHSLPHPRVLKNISRFYSLQMRSWKLRWKAPRESEDLWAYFRKRHEKGISYLYSDTGHDAMVAGVWLCTRKRTETA
ncbi:MAG: 50S ribosomal protein L11 methyltransferase [Desulfobacterales bacterium]|nr:50S ribosomal protein L11 methyltransferase [Desulfobacterales bacterium]